jgi:large subunit ribosomal protein L30
MICLIRISGDVNLRGEIRDTLYRLRMRRKYACVVVKPNKVNLGMIEKVKDKIAFGEITNETFEKLIVARGQLVDRKKSKPDAKKVVAGILEGKDFEEFNLKPFFRLHPPRGGIESKKHFGVGHGVLGNQKDQINKLVDRML